MVAFAKANVAGLLMTQRQMAFTHPFAVEFKRLAYEAVKRRVDPFGQWLPCQATSRRASADSGYMLSNGAGFPIAYPCA
jgi:hypothetical protein